MALPIVITTHEIRNTSGYNFHTTMKLEKGLLTENLRKKDIFSTIIKTDGEMPDVKSDLMWSYSQFDNTFYFRLHFESEKEINYQAYLHYFLNTREAKGESGKSVGKKVIDLCVIPYNDAINDYFIDGKLTIFVEGCFSYTDKANNISVKSNDISEWGQRLKHNSPEDFDIVIGDKSIKIHKMIFAAESSVFARMFESNFKEAQENRVSIPEFKYEIVQAAVDYCYAQNIFAFLDKNENKNIIDLLYFCNKYDFKTLKPKLENLLIQILSKENVSILAATADKTNALKLRQACIYLIRKLIERQEFLFVEESSAFDIKFMGDVFVQALSNSK